VTIAAEHLKEGNSKPKEVNTISVIGLAMLNIGQCTMRLPCHTEETSQPEGTQVIVRYSTVWDNEALDRKGRFDSFRAVLRIRYLTSEGFVVYSYVSPFGEPTLDKHGIIVYNFTGKGGDAMARARRTLV
jgi:hypothetical protein